MSPTSLLLATFGFRGVGFRGLGFRSLGFWVPSSVFLPGRHCSPTRLRTNKLFTVCSFILVVEMCERLCYYTLQGRIEKGLSVISVGDYKVVPKRSPSLLAEIRRLECPCT